jgi:hypothetical protein
LHISCDNSLICKNELVAVSAERGQHSFAVDEERVDRFEDSIGRDWVELEYGALLEVDHGPSRVAAAQASYARPALILI